MAISHDLNMEFENDDPGVDLGLFEQNTRPACPLQQGDLDTSARPGWLRVKVHGSCGQWSDRGNVAMLLRGSHEDTFYETAIDLATAWREGAGTGGTPPSQPGQNGIDYGLIIFDEANNRQVIQFSARVQDNQVTTRVHTLNKWLATSPVLGGWGSSTLTTVWLRIERTSRSSRRFNCFYKTSETAAWTRLASVGESALPGSGAYYPWSTEISNLQYGLFFKTFAANPSGVAGADFVADFKYLRSGQWFDEPGCLDRPLYYWLDAPSSGPLNIDMTDLRHGMYRYWARVQAVTGSGTDADPYVFGPWSAPSGRFLPIPKPPPLVQTRGGNANTLAYARIPFYQESIDYKPRASNTRHLTNWLGMNLGATSGVVGGVHRNGLSTFGQSPRISPRVNWDRTGIEFGWDSSSSTSLRRSDSQANDFQPGGDEMTYAIVFRSRKFESNADFLFAGGSRVGAGNGYAGLLWKDGSVGFRAVNGGNRAAQRITGQGHNMPQLLIGMITWASSSTRCLSVRVNGYSHGIVNNGFTTIPENGNDRCTSSSVWDNSDGFILGAHIGGSGSLTQELEGEVYSLMVMREELNEFNMVVDGSSQRATELYEDYLARRHYLKCAGSESPNVGTRTGSTRGFPSSEACRRGQWNNGWCEEQCATGATLQLGSNRRTCRWGAWETAHPVCGRMCPNDEGQAIVDTGATVCTRRLFSLNFDSEDMTMAGEHIWGMRVRPRAPDYSLQKHFDLSSGRSMRFKTLEPSCNEAPMRMHYAMSAPGWAGSNTVTEFSTTATITLWEPSQLRRPRAQAGVTVNFHSETRFYSLEISSPAPGTNASLTRTVRIVKVDGSTEKILASATGAEVDIRSGVPYVLRLSTTLQGNVLRARVHYAPNASTPIPSAARGAWWERSPELQAETDEEALWGPVIYDVEVSDSSSPITRGAGGLVFIGEGEVDDYTQDSPCSSQLGGTTCDHMGVFGSCVRQCGAGYQYGSGTPTSTCSGAGTYSNLPKVLAGGSTQAMGSLVCTVKPPTLHMTAPYVREVEEDSPVNAAVGEPLDARVDSPDIAVEYSLTDDAGGMFKIGRCTGQLLVGRASLDYETRTSYMVSVRITAADGSGRSASIAINVTVQVTDRNEAPYWAPDGDTSTLSLTLPENATVGQLVPGGTLTALDPDGPSEPIAYELLVAGPTSRTFVIDNETGVLSVGPDGPNYIDFESGEPVLTVLARAYDPRFPDDPTVETSRFVDIVILNSPDPPRFDEPLDPAERYIAFTNLQDGTVVSEALLATDQDAQTFTEADESQGNGTVAASLVLTYSLVSGGMGTDPRTTGPAVQVFDVDANSGQLVLTHDMSAWYSLSSEDKGVSPSGRPYMDVFNGVVRVTDTTGLTGDTAVSLFVIANTSVRGLPIVTSVEISAAGPNTQDGSSLDRLATLGGDYIRILGENFAAPGSQEPITLNLTMQGAVGGIVFTTTDCRHVTPQELNCTAPPGIGLVRASVAVADRFASPAATANVELRYASPDISVAVYGDVDPFGVDGVPEDSTASGADGNLNTRGGDRVTLLGSSLGPDHPQAASYLSVRYGPLADPTRYSASVKRVLMRPASMTDALYGGAVVIETQPGVGTDLVFTIEVLGDEEGSDEASTSLSYERPILASVAAASAAVDLDALRTAGGEAVRLTGSGFGPPRQDGTSYVTAVYSKTLFGVTLGGSDPTPSGFPALSCAPDGDSHTSVVCVTSPGTGAMLGWAAIVEGQVADTSAAAATDVDASYAPPVVMEVFGPGASDADTRGGDVVSLRGTNFPPVTTLATLVSAVYGPASALGRHAAQDCAPVSLGLDSVGVVTCTLSEGTGRDHQWAITVDGQTSPFTTDANTSYGAPTLSFFSGADIETADTAGTTLVTITGTNFGPNLTDAGGMLSLVSATYQTRLAQSMTASQQGSGRRTLGLNGTVLLSAADCVMTVPHLELRCRKTEGAGEGFAWSIVVDGQASGAPRTSYAAPRVDAVLAEDGVSPAPPADTAGGTVYTLSGANFGPAEGASPFGSLVQSVRFGASGSERAVRSWAVLSHTRLRVTLPSGLGSNLRFTVTVADQPSAMSPPFSYSPPVVLSVSPSVVSSSATQSQRRITVRGTSLGVVAAAGGAIYAAVGSPQQSSDALVGDSVRLLPVRSSRVLPVAEASVVGEQEVVVDLPAGTGPLRAVRVVAVPSSESNDDGGDDAGLALQNVGDARQRGASVSEPTMPLVAGEDAVDYTAPVTESVIVSRPTTTDELSVVQDMVGSGSGASSARIVYVVGRGFGPAPASLYSSLGNGSTALEEPGVRRQATLRVGTAPLVQTFVVPVTGPAAGSSALRILAWSDTEVKLACAVSQGEVSLQITTRDFGWQEVTQSTTLEPFSGLSPTISALEGADTPFPTTGGQASAPLVIRAANLANTLSLAVKVGGNDCPLLNEAGQRFDTVADTVEADIQRQFDAARALGTAVQDIVYTLRCIVPPGQGSVVPVVIERDANASAPSSASIAYAAPTLTRVSAHDEPAGGTGPLPTARSAWPTQLSLVVPTTAGVIRVEGSNLGPCPSLVMADSDVLEACVPGTTTLQAGVRMDVTGHSWAEFPAAPGEGRGTNFNDVGPLGYQVRVVSADQAATPASISMQYAAPTVLSVSGSPSPLTGGMITLTGRDFGQPTRGPTDGVAPLVEIRMPSVERSGVGSRTAMLVECTSPVRDASHTTLTCMVPPGTGRDLQLRVRVADLDPVETGRSFSFARPMVSSVSVEAGSGRRLATMTASSVPTVGEGTVLRLSGSHFGAFDALTSCVFASWPAAPKAEAVRTAQVSANWWVGTQLDDPALAGRLPAAPLSCSGLAEWRGEGELQPSEVLSWSDNEVAVSVPAGVGSRSVWVVAGGNMATEPVRLLYAAPSLAGASLDPPAVSTDGSEATMLVGASNLGPATRDTSSEPVADANFPLSIEDERMLPTAAVVVNVSTVCASDGSALDNSGETVSDLQRCGNPAQRFVSSGYVVSRSHTSLTLMPPVGVGTDHAVGVMVVENGAVVASSSPADALMLHYRRPTVVSTDPTQLGLDGDVVPGAIASALADTTGQLASAGGSVGSIAVPAALDCVNDPQAGLAAAQAMASGDSHPGFGETVPTKRLLVEVENVGSPPSDLCDSSYLPWDPLDRVLNVSVGDRACTRAYRVRARGRLYVQCDMPNAPVGFHDVAVFAAGQLGLLAASEPRAMEVVCDNGFFGKPGQMCLPCPSGSTCSGYDTDVADLSDAGRAIVLEYTETGTSPDGNNATVMAALAPYTDPRPEEGFFNLNTSQMLEACPFSNRIAGRSVCITPCEPKFACTGDNFCKTGYASTAPEFRCNSCAQGYYRRAGLCEKCPDQPWLIVVVLAVVAIFAIIGAWWLNRIGGAISFIQIGVDYMQVLAIFASARFALPDELRDLFAILSALNLNIDIVAPECFIPDVDAIEKWFVFQAIPLVVVLMLVLSFVGSFVWSMLCKRRKCKEAVNQAGFDRSINLVIVFMYVLYLQSSKTSLDAMACVPTDPPQTDENGEVITYLQMVFEPCAKPGGVHQTLLPFAIITLGVYSIGYPAFCAYVLWRHWKAIYLDQLLRAAGTGETESTNRVLWLRHRYGRVYNFFKPTRAWWILVLLARKFLIALITLWFSVNPAYQLAMTLLVLFMAFALQVRLVPFMSAPERAQVLVEHRSRAMTSPTSLDAKLKVTVDRVEAQGRRRSTFSRGLDASSARSLASSLGSMVVGSILVSANGVELTMLFSAVLVTVSGLLFESGQLDSEFYAAQRDSLTYFVIVLVSLSLVYFALVLGVEMRALCLSANEKEGGKKGKRAVRGAGGGKKGKEDDSSSSGGASGRRSMAAGFIAAVAGSGAGGGTDEAVLKAAARRTPADDDTTFAQQSNPMFASGSADGEPSEARPEAVASAFLTMSAPPDASEWAVFKTTMQRLQARVMDLQREVNASTRMRDMRGVPAATPGKASSTSSSRRPSMSGRKAFGQSLASTGGDDDNSSAGGNSGGSGSASGAGLALTGFRAGPGRKRTSSAAKLASHARKPSGALLSPRARATSDAISPGRRLAPPPAAAAAASVAQAGSIAESEGSVTTNPMKE